MTKKKIYPQPLTPAHTQTFSLRQAPLGIAQINPSRDQDFARYKREESHELPHGRNLGQRHDLGRTQPILFGSPDSSRASLAPSGVYAEALSPASMVSPSEASNAPSVSSVSTTRKRAWTESDGETSRYVKPNRGTSDLAGLLNPVIESPAPPPLQSPTFSTSESDKGSYWVARIANRLQTDVVPEIDRGFSQPSGTLRLPELKPRPADYYDRTNNRRDAEDTANEIEEQKKKGRRGPLESDQRRKEVLEVRELGACLRCHIMRIRCNAVSGKACTNCQTTLPKSRKWTVPCTREWLKSRYKYLLPDLLVERNDPRKVVPNVAPENLAACIEIPLTHTSRLSFPLDVCEVLDPNLDPTAFVHYFTDQKGEDSSATISLDVHHAPPFVPHVRPGRDSQTHAVQLMSKHLEEQMKDLSKTWILDVFPWGKSESWPREVLHMVIAYSREVSRSSALDHGLRSCLIRFLMNYAFYIPYDRMVEVNHQLSPRNRLLWNELKRMETEEEMWSPKIVNKWLKSALLKMLDHLLVKFFTELEGLFKLQETSGDHAKISDLDRDEAFCAIIVAFIVIGMMQTKLYVLAKVIDQESRDSERTETQEARRCISAQETEVVDHVLQLWKYRFCKQEMKGQPPADRMDVAQKSKNFEAIRWFERARETHADSLYGLDTTLNLTDEGEERFLTQNISRLLLKLSSALWRPRLSKP